MKIDLEYLTKKWWFYLIIIAIVFFLPPITSVPFNPWNSAEVVSAILMNAQLPFMWLAPIFHLATLLLVVVLRRMKAGAGRIFYVYLGLSYLLFAFVDNIAQTTLYGLGIVVSNVALMGFVGLLWFWAAFKYRKNFEFEPKRIPSWKYWLLPLAVLAFWAPANELGQMDLSPVLFLTSAYGIAFCMTTPVLVFILAFYHPNVYLPAFRVLCVEGIYFAVLNLLGPVMFVGYPVWLAVLHIPLLCISLYGLVLPKLEMRKR
jgi:hypothetical protein